MKCQKFRRCNKPLLCSECGDTWRRKNFKFFANSFVGSCNDNITYLVIKSNSFKTLYYGVEDCYSFLSDIKELKKRNKISDFYSRLEVSFTKNTLGFNPHINFIFFGDIGDIEAIANKHDLTVWKRKKTNDRNTILSLVWYILKFNNIAKDMREAVMTTINKRRTILHTKRFNKSRDELSSDEYLDMDFSFLGVMKVRSIEEINLRKIIKLERQKLNNRLKSLKDKESNYEY